MRKELAGASFIALASFQFGAVVVLGKVVSRTHLPVTSMLAIRFAVAALVLAAALAIGRRGLRPASGEGARLVVLGACGYAAEAALFFLGIARGTTTAVTLLFFTYPVVVTVLSLVLGAAPPGALVGGSLLAATAGSALVIASSGGLDISSAGIAFALGSAVVFALYLTGAERTLRRTPSMVGALWVSGSAAALLAAASVVADGRWPARGEWVPVLGMGTFTAGAFFCLFAGLRLLGAVRTAIVAALEPLSTALLAAVFLDERLRPGTAAGAALILAGALVASLARAAKTGFEPEAELP